MGKNQKLKQKRKIEAIKRQKQRKERNREIAKWASMVFALLVLFAIGFIWYKVNPPRQSSGTLGKISEIKKEANVKEYDTYPDMVIDGSKKYTAVFKTSKGDFTAELDALNTPKTVNNFVFLSQKGFYDGLTFHRIMKDFMIQGGDPNGDGTGDAGYKFDDEPIAKDYLPGTLAMANSGPNTNGSQFFIMTGDYSGGKLPKNYVIFGSVVNGMDTVQRIAEMPVEASANGEESKPKEAIVINTVEIKEQ